jgi:hypothetical protein
MSIEPSWACVCTSNARKRILVIPSRSMEHRKFNASNRFVTGTTTTVVPLTTERMISPVHSSRAPSSPCSHSRPDGIPASRWFVAIHSSSLDCPKKSLRASRGRINRCLGALGSGWKVLRSRYPSHGTLGRENRRENFETTCGELTRTRVKSDFTSSEEYFRGMCYVLAKRQESVRQE